MSVDFRQMRANDLPAAFAVRVSTVENAITMEALARNYGITPAGVAAAMQSDVQGWLCEADGDVVGFAMGNMATGEVTVVAVLPAYEGRGIGTALLGRVQDWLFAAGHDEIWLSANPDPALRAHGFYRRLGWRANGSHLPGDEKMILRRPRAAGAPATDG